MKFSFLFLLILISASGNASPDPSYSGYLPPDRSDRILQALKKIPFDENRLKKLPSLHFVSGQSYTANGAHVLNRIHFFPGPEIDLWLMRQNVEGKPMDPAQGNLLTIAVDKKEKQTYYFEYGKIDLTAHRGVPAPVNFTAACFMCHSGGPRAIRPQFSSLVSAFSAPEMKRLKQWNEVIRSYRVLGTFKPDFQGDPNHRVTHFLRDTASNARFPHPRCVECHDEKSGVRAPLLRQNGESILFLIDHGGMPLESSSLDEADRKCIRAWVENRHLEGCNSSAQAIGKQAQHWVLDPFKSHLVAVAKTPLGPIQVKDIDLSGGVSCDTTGKCSGEIRGDLRRITTGIALRDEHLKKLLQVVQYPSMTYTVQNTSLADPGAHGTLEFVSRSGALPTHLSCDGAGGPELRCKLSPSSLHLPNWKVAPPSFMGVHVAPDVSLQGEFYFRS